MNQTGATKSSFIIPISTLLIITLLCIGAVEGFYYILGKQLRPEQPRVEQPAPVQQPAQQPTPADPVIAGEERQPINPDISVITSRNLFGSRTGDTVIAAPQNPLEGMEASSLDIVLMGTVTAGVEDDRRAIIYDKKDGRQELYQEGDYIQQAAVKQILRGKVVLTIDGRDEMLDISQAREVNVPPPVPPLMPITTTEQVIGRPVGAAPDPAAAEQPPQQAVRPTNGTVPGIVDKQPQQQVVKPTTGSRVIIPRKGNQQLLRPIRQ